MAISSKAYGDLYEGSDVGGGRETGPFIKVFITGQPRPGQTPGTMSSIYPQKWDDEGDDKYLIRNASEVFFIPMFIKKIREHWVKDEKKIDRLQWFSFNPEKEENTPSGAKMVYLFAGCLLDSHMKPVMDKIEPDRTAFIFFKCNGAKFGSALDYVNAINKHGENLEPLSDDPNFEKAIVLPRRFICKTTVEIGDLNSHNNRPYIFKFNISNPVPDKTVETLMDRCMKWWDPFKTQFDMTGNTSSNLGDSREVSSSDKENVTFDSVGEDNGEVSSENIGVAEGIPEEELDLGI